MNKNYIISSHLLIPQIEAGIRYAFEKSGETVYKHAENGGLHLRNLNEILRDFKWEGTIGEDIRHYLITLLVDSHGWNLRNNICHGMLSLESFHSSASQWIFHTLILLGIMRLSK